MAFLCTSHRGPVNRPLPPGYDAVVVGFEDVEGSDEIIPVITVWPGSARSDVVGLTGKEEARIYFWQPKPALNVVSSMSTTSATVMV
jgi:hypothetical protein